MKATFKRIGRCCGIDTLKIDICHNNYDFVMTSTRIIFNIGLVSCVFLYKTIGKTKNNMYVSTNIFNKKYINNKIELANILENTLKSCIGEDIYFTSLIIEKKRIILHISIEYETIYSEIANKLFLAIEDYNR